MRQNIFNHVNENYDILEEAIKIDNLFHGTIFFVRDVGYNKECTFEEIMDCLWPHWSGRGATLSSQEFMKKAEAWIGTENNIINYLEVIENYIYFCTNNNELLVKNNIKVLRTFFSVFIHLVRLLEQRMGLSRKEFEDYVLIYPKNAPLEKVLGVCGDDIDAQWELIRYTREKLTLSEKQKSLAHFATIFSIEKSKQEDDKNLIDLTDKATNILNSLNIRHKNEGGIFVADQISDKDQSELCDYAYSLILSIILLRDQKKYKPIYEGFHNKQKAAKNKKEGDKKDD